MFMVASAVCWILTEPSLGRVSALESHSIEHLMVKTKYTRAEKGADVNSCCSKQNPCVLQQSGDNVALKLRIHHFRAGELSQLQLLNIHEQHNTKNLEDFLLGSCLGFLLKDAGMVLRRGAGMQRRWEKGDCTGGSRKQTRLFVKVGGSL